MAKPEGNKYLMTLPVIPVLVPILVVVAAITAAVYFPFKILFRVTRIVLGFFTCLSGEVFNLTGPKSIGELVVRYGCWIGDWSYEAWDSEWHISKSGLPLQ